MDLEQANWMIREGRVILDTSDQRFSGLHLEAWQMNLLREQVELRRRASLRFPEPQGWLWTLRSLAQASDWWCARFKASLFPANVPVLDGCCGAGADLVALAMRGTAKGIDRDPSLVALANSNLASHGLPESAQQGELPQDFENQSNTDAVQWLHLDPDRRAADSIDHRLRKAEDYSPSLTQSLAMARQTSGAILKLAPATILEPQMESAFQNEVGLVRCWLGNLGECRQQLLVTGEQLVDKLAKSIVDQSAKSRYRFAMLCEPNAEVAVISGQPQASCEGDLKPGRFIYDCHAVLHAAHLQMVWAESVGASPLGTSQGYFTSDTANCSAWAQCFEVVDVLPWDQRHVKRWLREHKIGLVEEKKRLLQLDANEHQRRLRGKGEAKITLLITRLGDRVRAVVARRL